jgi:SAM-dependent methyltransferase
VRLFKSRHPEIMVVQIGAKNSRGIEGIDIDLRHKTDMHEACWVLKHALMHIDGESGMVRTARSLHTTSAVLFGPTSAPFFSFDRNVNLVSEVCSDCWWSTPDWNSRCPRQLPEPECMTSIQPNHVVQRVTQFINSKQSHKPRYRIEASALYATNLLAGREVAEICRTLNLPVAPISEHTHGAESGIYIHASKQWEYVFALKVLAQRGEKLRIADVGGGRGAIAPYLAKQRHDVTIFDIDYRWDDRGDPSVQDRFIAWSRANHLNVRFGSLFNVPAEDESFDVVLSMSVMEHVPHKQYAMKEAMRILLPGGLLVMSFDLTLDAKQLEDAMRVEIFTPERLRAILQGLGLEDQPFGSDEISQSGSPLF